MEVIAERACGIDVHQGMLMCCALIGAAGTRPTREIRQFGTMTDELLKLRQWLQDQRITHVGMEGTGVYWMPLYQILEGNFEVIIGNAQHIKNVPGRKTDVKDSVWLADLTRHGLIAKSFIPAKPFRELRYLTRYRTSLIGARTADRNRLLKLLESMNIKLASVLSDVFGVSGMSMLRALAEGTATPEQIANLAKGQLRRKDKDIRRALIGTLGERQRSILRVQLHRLDSVQKHIAEIDSQIQEALAPYQQELDWLMTIPGVDFIVASNMIGELGVDFSSFRYAGALCNWVGICPGSGESAGKRKSTRIRPGNRYLKPMLVEAAQSVAGAKSGYLREKFWKTSARLGRKNAAVVVAHKIVIAAYAILTRREPYKDLGADYLAKLNEAKALQVLAARASKLGYKAHFEALMPDVSPAAPPADASPAKGVPSSGPRVRHYQLRPFVPPTPAAAESLEKKPALLASNATAALGTAKPALRSSESPTVAPLLVTRNSKPTQPAVANQTPSRTRLSAKTKKKPSPPTKRIAAKRSQNRTAAPKRKPTRRQDKV